MADVSPDDFTDGARFIGKVSAFVSSERESANEGNTCDTNECVVGGGGGGGGGDGGGGGEQGIGGSAE